MDTVYEDTIEEVREKLIDLLGCDILEEIAQQKLRAYLTDYDGAIGLALPEVLLQVLEQLEEERMMTQELQDELDELEAEE